MSVLEFNNRYQQQDQIEQEQEATALKLKENPAACVFVASLNKDLEDAELQSHVYHHFEQWGCLLGVKVLKDWLKRPYAFVQYQEIQDCKTALKEAPGTILNGRSIRCEPARVNRSIFLISMNQPFNKKNIQNTLSVFGEIEDITILQPHGKLHSVFVKYKYRDDAIQAYLTLKFPDQHASYYKSGINNNQQWFVEWASNLDSNNLFGLCGNSCRLDRFSVFVGNLNEDISQNDLYEEFGGCGIIVNVHIIRKPYYRHRTKKVFAFIKYENERGATEAIDQKNGLTLNGKTLRVCYRQYYCNNSNRNYMNKTFPVTTTMASPAMVQPNSCYYLKYQSSSQQQKKTLTPPQPYMEEYPASYIYMPYNSSTTPTIYDPCMTPMMPQQLALDNNIMASGFSTDASGNTQPINPINTNSNIEDCYYVDPYPTMVYYTYSPYTPYKINTSLVKNVGTNKQGVTTEE